jgi:hypothetical protein
MQELEKGDKEFGIQDAESGIQEGRESFWFCATLTKSEPNPDILETDNYSFGASLRPEFFAVGFGETGSNHSYKYKR